MQKVMLMMKTHAIKMAGACAALAGLFASAAAVLAVAPRRDDFTVCAAALLSLLALAAGAAATWIGLIQPLHALIKSVDDLRRTGRFEPAMRPGGPLGALTDGLSALASDMAAQRRKLTDSILDLERLNEELDQLAHVKDDFLMAINHQLRTPLMALTEGVGLLAENPAVSGEDRQLLESMGQSARRLTGLVEDMLDLSLLTSGRRPLARMPTDLTQLLRAREARWRELAHPRALQLGCAALPLVYMDGAAVQEVLDHLVRNAARRAEGDDPVQVRGTRQGEMAQVVVANCGPGLTEEQARQLFQPFSHVHTPDAPGSEGSGLGLAFCRQVLERHHGSIVMEPNEAARETRIVLQLPLATPAFLLTDAVRAAQGDADAGHGAAGLVLAVGAPGALDRAEKILRRNTARRDRFVRLDGGRLVIVANTDEAGLAVMRRRLSDLLLHDGLEVALGTASAATDGTEPERLLATAEGRLRPIHAPEVHATIRQQPQEVSR